jgi:hypothetical protein
MAGLVPAIHVFRLAIKQDVDARDKHGHDAALSPHPEVRAKRASKDAAEAFALAPFEARR